MKQISANALKKILSDGGEIAFLDVREHGQYGEGHPFFCVHLPYSQLESLAPHLMPCLNVRCVVMDAADGVADRAAAALENIGYSDVHILTGGAPGWAAAGYGLFKGVNVPSKAFGELAEHELGTLSVSAEELNALQQNCDNLLVLDGRSAPEFHKMSLPGAKSCPNAELGYRLSQMARDKNTTVVINCAGRTRSIIGAQSLRLLGVTNPVYALRNGTQGWRLAGYDLVHKATPAPLPEPDATALTAARTKVAQLVQDYNLRTIDTDTVQAWLADPKHSTYLFDVRTENEFIAGHIAGSQSAPGGQLVQATDEKLAVRHARIVLACDTGLRAATTAIWLTGMGHQVWLLDVNAAKGGKTGTLATPQGCADTITIDALQQRLQNGAVLLDASRGLDYRACHVTGAIWVTRARLPDLQLSVETPIIVTGRNRHLISGIVADLRITGHHHIDSICANPDDWRAASLDVVSSPETPSEQDCIDYLFFVHDRHDGNLDAARRYLEWEVGLLAQLDDQECAVLRPLHPPAA